MASITPHFNSLEAQSHLPQATPCVSEAASATAALGIASLTTRETPQKSCLPSLKQNSQYADAIAIAKNNIKMLSEELGELQLALMTNNDPLKTEQITNKIYNVDELLVIARDNLLFYESEGKPSKIFYDNGKVYEGEIKDGLPHGKGMVLQLITDRYDDAEGFFEVIEKGNYFEGVLQPKKNKVNFNALIAATNYSVSDEPLKASSYETQKQALSDEHLSYAKLNRCEITLEAIAYSIIALSIENIDKAIRSHFVQLGMGNNYIKNIAHILIEALSDPSLKNLNQIKQYLERATNHVTVHQLTKEQYDAVCNGPHMDATFVQNHYVECVIDYDNWNDGSEKEFLTRKIPFAEIASVRILIDRMFQEIQITRILTMFLSANRQ